MKNHLMMGIIVHIPASFEDRLVCVCGCVWVWVVRERQRERFQSM